jgi:phage-related holin
MQFEHLDDLAKTESYIDAKLALITSFTFLGVNYGLILLLWVFMVADTVLGVAKAGKLYGWAGVTRGKFLAGVGTKVAILFIPFSLALIGALAGYDLNIFVHTALYALIANDLVSCYTNILSIKTGKNHVNKDFVEMLINGLRRAIYLSVKNAIDKLAASDFIDDENFKTAKKRPSKKGPDENYRP